MLGYMKREYTIVDIINKLHLIQKSNPDALIATDIIVGFLGESDELFEETYSLLQKSPINRLHVFRFSNRPHTAAYYLKDMLVEPPMEKKRKWSKQLMELSKEKYSSFLSLQIGKSSHALVIAHSQEGMKILLNNHCDGILIGKQCLPGELVHVTIIAAKDDMLICKES
jgi:threonylcarbamoyladenosine tRNA methylthiotransferase MtaB